MWEATVQVQRAMRIRASPEQVWSLFASPAMWSLRSTCFAFDAASPSETRRFRVVLGIGRRSGRPVADVFEVTDEVPGQSLTWSRVSASQARHLSFCFSVASGKRGTKAVMTVRSRVPLWAKVEAQLWWAKQLKPWLAECAATLEDRRPWPEDGLPADIRAACMARPSAKEMDEAVSVSASALISAPLDRTWQLLWDPATSLLVNPDLVAVGTLPGTPCRQVGEIKYSIHRLSSGHLHAHLVAVDELDEGRTALVRDIQIRKIYTETHHQVEPESHETRLTFTLRVLHPAANNQRQELEGHVATLVSGYKSAIETPNP